MPDLPSGTVTLFFTDVEGSTRALGELGDDYAVALAEHRRVFREVVSRHAGVEVDTQGDAFFVAFARAGDAVAAAREAQRALLETPLRIRIGIHTGEPRLTGEGYVGIDVVRASRIAAVGHGGQVLVSQTTRDLVDGSFELRDLGEHRLKDMAEPVHIYQLGHGEFPPLKSLNNTNVPVPLEPLVGRKKELADVLRVVHGGGRLVTLTGPGGIGKTRLALELAAELVAEFTHGVWFADLGAVRDPALVLPTVASAVGARTNVDDHLADRELLLVLDNFEGVVQEGPEVARLIAAAPKLVVLVTSRERLRLAGEREYPLRPLAEAPAVELFRQRATAVIPEFEGDYLELVQLCKRLDGLPLAIELAAARTKLLPPSTLLERLERRLHVLEGGPRDAPARHRTLRATIDWSYALLSAEEQRLFERLAVFRGGFTLEAAEAVCDAVLETLASLVDKSLVHTAGERFAMLETIREYAAERLEPTGDEPALRQRHARYFLALAERFEPLRHDAADAESLARVGADQDNFRAALAASSVEPEVQLRLAVTLWPFWRARGNLGEARHWISETLRAARDDVDLLRARALEAASDLAGSQGDYEEAKRAAADSLAAYERLRHREGTARALMLRGWWALQGGDSEEARPLFERALEESPASPLARERLGVLALHDGDYRRARQLFEETLATYRQQDDATGIRVALMDLGLVALAEGRSDEAESFFRESLPLFVAEGDTWGVSYCVEDLAAVIAPRDPERAAELLGWADLVRERLRHPLDAFEQGIHDRTLAVVDGQLDPDVVAAAWDRGRQMTREEAVRKASGA